MVARSSSDAPTYSSAETRRKEKRREMKVPKRVGGGELGACVLGSSSQNVVRIQEEGIGRHSRICCRFFPVFCGFWSLLNTTSDTFLVKQCNEMLGVKKKT